MKILAIGGAPGTGKSTLMKRLMQELDINSFSDAIPLVPYHYNAANNVVVLGKYEENAGYAQGTDRMSMAVQPKAITFVNSLPSNRVIMFEGDRLFTASFLEHLAEMSAEFKAVVLTVPEKTRKARYEERGSNQDETWLKGRLSKISNIESSLVLMDYIERFPHETLADQDKIVDFVKGYLSDNVRAK
jgi:2-phosphoglycerate kinase